MAAADFGGFRSETAFVSFTIGVIAVAEGTHRCASGIAGTGHRSDGQKVGRTVEEGAGFPHQQGLIRAISLYFLRINERSWAA